MTGRCAVSRSSSRWPAGGSWKYQAEGFSWRETGEGEAWRQSLGTGTPGDNGCRCTSPLDRNSMAAQATHSNSVPSSLPPPPPSYYHPGIFFQPLVYLLKHESCIRYVDGVWIMREKTVGMLLSCNIYMGCGSGRRHQLIATLQSNLHELSMKVMKTLLNYSGIDFNQPNVWYWCQILIGIYGTSYKTVSNTRMLCHRDVTFVYREPWEMASEVVSVALVFTSSCSV